MAGFVKWIPGQPLQNSLPRNRSAAFGNWNLKSLYQTEKNDKIPAGWPLQPKPSCISLRLPAQTCATCGPDPLQNSLPVNKSADFSNSIFKICRFLELESQKPASNRKK
ncbi:MAG: hypothetical protein PUC71_05065 [Oscillospiraceae bacterium]|nr:hypothetical protein [Oscillospiraceae bacterium]